MQAVDVVGKIIEGLPGAADRDRCRSGAARTCPDRWPSALVPATPAVLMVMASWVMVIVSGRLLLQFAHQPGQVHVRAHHLSNLGLDLADRPLDRDHVGVTMTHPLQLRGPVRTVARSADALEFSAAAR